MQHLHQHFPPLFPGTVKPSSPSVSPTQQPQSVPPSSTTFSYEVQSATIFWNGELHFSSPVTPEKATVAAANKAEHAANLLDFPFDQANLTIKVWV